MAFPNLAPPPYMVKPIQVSGGFVLREGAATNLNRLLTELPKVPYISGAATIAACLFLNQPTFPSGGSAPSSLICSD
jgi:hypothetical protein